MNFKPFAATFAAVALWEMSSGVRAADPEPKVRPVATNSADAAAAARESLIEMVAEADETLMEKFFEAGTLTQDQLVSGLRAATAAGKLFPLFCTSAALNNRG